jgi:heptosyltransferase-1
VVGAKITIGVDTGLTHLAAILNLPTIELYCDSPRWKTEGYWSPNIHNLGDKGRPPSVDEVLNSVNALLKK